jgi:hypothetical protein
MNLFRYFYRCCSLLSLNYFFIDFYPSIFIVFIDLVREKTSDRDRLGHGRRRLARAVHRQEEVEKQTIEKVPLYIFYSILDLFYLKIEQSC